ncbi:MAG: Na(+)/H(+) antiporter subunit B [Planctomycetes bacterium]|nr:Na(+)/H(+) antiporter subunit B [Planctomycetota bacterium]
MKDQLVLRIVAKIMIPFIIVFGLYVITHGEIGPGGGFQGGVVIASAFILFGMIFGKEELEKAFPNTVVLNFAAVGVLIYAGVGVWNLFCGGNFLDYSYIVSSDPQMGEAWGMTLVEYGVGLTVCTIMIVIYNMITERIGDE